MIETETVNKGGGKSIMTGNKVTLTNFINKERFDLDTYLIHLFNNRSTK